MDIKQDWSDDSWWFLSLNGHQLQKTHFFSMTYKEQKHKHRTRAKNIRNGEMPDLNSKAMNNQFQNWQDLITEYVLSGTDLNKVVHLYHIHLTYTYTWLYQQWCAVQPVQCFPSPLIHFSSHFHDWFDQDSSKETKCCLCLILRHSNFICILSLLLCNVVNSLSTAEQSGKSILLPSCSSMQQRQTKTHR